MPKKKIYKNRIKEVRKSKKLSLEEVGHAIGVGNSTVSRYENGNREPSFENWKKLADFFGVTVPYLQGISYDEKEILGWINSDYITYNKKLGAEYDASITKNIRKLVKAKNEELPENKFTNKQLKNFDSEVEKYWQKLLTFVFSSADKSLLLSGSLSESQVVDFITIQIIGFLDELNETAIGKAFNKICGNDLDFWQVHDKELTNFASKKDIQRAINHLQQSLNSFSDELKGLPENKNITFQVPDGFKTTMPNDKRQ